MAQGDYNGSSSLEEEMLKKYAQENEDDIAETETPPSNDIEDNSHVALMKQNQTISLSSDNTIETIRKLREIVGQVSELEFEEDNIVAAYSSAFTKLMAPLTKALPVDVSILPPELGEIKKANVITNGELVILSSDGNMLSVDLIHKDNRNLLITVINDVMPKLNNLLSQRRIKIEKRIDFLSRVTKELQSIADAVLTGS
jgi:hypothetical protein